jgi:hypothetical protein
MKLDKFVNCVCGKKKKIEWFNKVKFRTGENSFCIGITKCTRCGKVLQHYSGNMKDVQRFIDDYDNLIGNISHD